MYKFVAIFALIAVASSARISRAVANEPIEILRSDSDVKPDGSYTFSFEGADGTSRQEVGTLQNAGQEDAFVAVVGSYKYTDAEGTPIEVKYTSDQNGFVPSGGNIPAAIENAARAAAGAH